MSSRNAYVNDVLFDILVYARALYMIFNESRYFGNILMQSETVVESFPVNQALELVANQSTLRPILPTALSFVPPPLL